MHNQGSYARLTPLTEPVPDLSVVIPTYGRPRQLAACLAAFAEVDCGESTFEVVVVDDGSPEPLDEVAGPFADRLQVRVIRQDNRGAATARNTGALAARGRVLAFTDDDCLPDEDWLSELLRALPEAGDACAGGRTINVLEHNSCSVASQLLVDYIYEYYNRDGPEFFTSNNLAVPAAAFEELGGFDTEFPFSGGEDRDFCSRWLHSGRRLVYVPDAVIRHAHAMNLLGFWRQHFHYGRGAGLFHERRSAREGRRRELEPVRFYLDLLLYPFRRLGWLRATYVSGLLFVAQVANALGYFYELRRSKAARATKPPAG